MSFAWVPGYYSSDIGKTHCPACRCVVELATFPEKGEKQIPGPGDFLLCFECATILVILPGFRLRVSNEGDRATLDSDPDLREKLFKMQKALILKRALERLTRKSNAH